MRILAVLALIMPLPSLAEPAFSDAADELLQLCRFGWAGPARIEHYHRNEEGWKPGVGGTAELQLVFHGEDLAELRFFDGTEHYESVSVVCYRQTGWPVVAVTSEWFVGHKMCSGGRPLPIPSDGPLQLRVEKLTRFAASGLHEAEMSLMLGDQRQDSETYCGPDGAIGQFLHPLEYLGPAPQILDQLWDIRGQ